jgi:hypothetical protein
MTLLANAFDKFDKAMGIESVPCLETDLQALALVEAGLGLLNSDIEIKTDTKLSDIGTPPELLKVLKNLDAVYLRTADITIGNDIIADVTVGEMITHLDATQVNTLIDTMIEEERREASNMMHASLDQLDKTIRA